ncbi:BNR-4 repeat-containing protein [Kibdelosporangium aridum]|uniref:BNR-4 repeat-containing protein n=1 Tax=Kibdelosporangium aridum TaxID=2030 RepID=UPI000A954A3E
MRPTQRILTTLTVLATAVALAPAVQAAQSFTVMTPATEVASRTDRRPVAGGLYDAKVNKTFISWSGKAADTYVQAYDHRSKTWSAPKFIAAGQSDPHNYPTMIQANDGHILLVRGMHNTATVISRAPQPHSLDGDWTTYEAPAGKAASYPMPFKTVDGTLFVFYRETTRDIDKVTPTDTRPMKYLVSKDNGLTWKNSVELTGKPFAIGSTSRPDNMNEIYIGQLRQDPLTGLVHIVYTLAGGGPTQHVHDYYHRNIYYAVFNPYNLHFYSASWRDLGHDIDDADQETHLKVAETPLERPTGTLKSPDYIQQVGGNIGRPFLLWFTFDNTTGTQLNHASVWNGRNWETQQVASGLRTREVERVNLATWRVYATRDGQPNIETYLLTFGKNWRQETVIPTRKPVQRVEVIGNFRDPARILASGASSARDVAIADGDIYVAGK